ncbi:MAG: NifB/NifX family molybdenum-iron cluster-binding protein [Phycisphaeraceae bacterium]
MKIAIPVADGQLTPHFGQCRQVAMLSVNEAERQIEHEALTPAPPHQPGLFPQWLQQQGADVVIAGGMGQRALMLFAEAGIEVVLGAPCLPARQLAEAYLAGQLQGGANACSHGPDHQCSH